MERAGIDRRPGMEVPAKKPRRTARFAYLARSGQAKESILTSSSMAFAAFVAMAFLYGVDSYFFDGYYGSTAWRVVWQIGAAFGF
jgi:hypothetical protein